MNKALNGKIIALGTICYEGTDKEPRETTLW